MTKQTTDEITDEMQDEEVDELLDEFGADDEDDLANILFEEALVIQCVCCGGVCTTIITRNGDPYCCRQCARDGW